MLDTPPHAELVAPSPDLVARLTSIVGADNAITAPADQAPYLKEWRDLYSGRTPLVLRPNSTEQVAAILALCHTARVGVVPQGGNTGLVGGQIPHEDRAEIVLSLTRLNRIRHVDPGGGHLIAEAGVTLLTAQDTAEAAGRLFPLSLASEGSCQIGGVMATNAGGVQVLAYGNARNLALGIEAVLADGSIIHGLRALKKDNTGYDLKDLLIGSEGTLGVITAVALKLLPRPAEVATAFVALPGIEAVSDLFRTAETVAGSSLTAFEFLDRTGLDMVLRHAPGTRDPLGDPHPWYVLFDVSAGREDGSALSLVEGLLTDAVEAGLVLDATIAGSLAQRSALWKLREALSEAQKPEGGSIKHDISVAVHAIPEFIRRAGPLVERVCPGARPVPFGHFGDGNVHYNVSQPVGMDKAAYLAMWHTMADAVHGLVHDMSGSISAEHGIGRLKRDDLPRFKSPAELAAMRAIKAALDPRGILNPGKVV
ncbi:MAG: FAD-binding oxidoreductase [Hyphomicrobiaceae bacterium]|nr:FAD-binding oxidoreductase [Hyphomicrobiaceae bacterium]